MRAGVSSGRWSGWPKRLKLTIPVTFSGTQLSIMETCLMVVRFGMMFFGTAANIKS